MLFDLLLQLKFIVAGEVSVKLSASQIFLTCFWPGSGPVVKGSVLQLNLETHDFNFFVIQQT